MALLTQAGPGNQYEETDGSKSMQVRLAGTGDTAGLALDVSVDGLESLATTGNANTLALLAPGKTASATFTPAASSHTAGDVNGAAGTFALSAPSACTLLITDANLLINSATAEATAWRLYLYNVTPPSAYADAAAWDLASGDQASFLGYIDLGTAIDLGSSQWVENRIVNKAVKLSGTSLFGYLINLTTLTPAAVAHTVTISGTPI
jgi:hypothetical protein